MRTETHRPGYAALRSGRVSIPGQAYILTWATSERRPILHPLDGARAMIRSLIHSDGCGWTETFAFVVMPDHVHWCIRLGYEKCLSDIVCSVKRYSARELKTLTSLNDRIWQSGFHDRALRSGDDLVATSRYVVANPLRAGLAHKIGDYAHWDAVWMDSFIQ